jgi:hypothetical protein
MAPVGFETEIPAIGRPQTHALDRTTTGIGAREITISIFVINVYIDSIRNITV